jgi:hypothetical protein
MSVDRGTYQRWWELHARVARGEPLSAEDQSFYDQVRRELEADESRLVSSQTLAAARANVAALEAERAALASRVQQLSQEIAAVEAALAGPVVASER